MSSPDKSVLMAGPNQLLSLIKLLDDESDVVREEVMRGFTTFGPSLADEIKRQHLSLTDAQRRLLQPLLDASGREWLRQVWQSWFTIESDKKRLETALAILADFLSSRIHPLTLEAALDQLAQRFTSQGAQVNAIELASFLFYQQGLKGAPPDDYYNPQNSNLIYVIEQKRGIPISLTCLYILVGHRVGLAIEGCNFPGHFLAIAPVRQRRVLVDCFNGGRLIQEKDLARIKADITIEDILRLQCQSAVIIARILRNLRHAYQQAGKDQDAQLMSELLLPLQEEIGSSLE